MASAHLKKIFTNFEKFDEVDGCLIVRGIASTEDVDTDGDIITAEAMRAAIPEYLAKGTIREMHGAIAAGTPMEMSVGDDGKTRITAKIVDPITIKKIKEGVLKGFSIGGKWLKKTGSKITSLVLKDVSVVDIPNNPNCTFEIAKFDDLEKQNKDMDNPTVDLKPIEASIASLVTKLDAIEKRLAEPFKIVEKDATITAGDIIKMQQGLNSLETELKSTRQSVEENNRGDLIAKMDKEGKCPIDPETGVAYKLEQLQKMDTTILKLLYANSPVVPTASRTSLLKSANQPAVDPNLKGLDKTAALLESRMPNLASAIAQRS